MPPLLSTYINMVVVLKPTYIHHQTIKKNKSLLNRNGKDDPICIEIFFN